MALAVAPPVSYFGNAFRIEPSSNETCKPLQPPAQVSGISAELLVIYQACNKMHKKMRKKEVKQQTKRTSYCFRSHSDANFQQYRATLVDWLCQVGQQCSLHSLTIHSAVAFLDSLVDILPVDTSRLYLVAAATLLIAAKMEEMEDKIPRVALLDRFTGNRHAGLIPRFETMILNCLQWELIVLTPSHFLGYYLEAALLPAELGANVHLQNFEKAKAYLFNMAEFLIDLCEHYSIFREYLPSVVAASAVAASRQMLKVAPYWSSSLALLSALPQQAVDPCVSLITRYYQQSFASIA